VEEVVLAGVDEDADMTQDHVTVLADLMPDDEVTVLALVPGNVP